MNAADFREIEVSELGFQKDWVVVVDSESDVVDVPQQRRAVRSEGNSEILTVIWWIASCDRVVGDCLAQWIITAVLIVCIRSWLRCWRLRAISILVENGSRHYLSASGGSTWRWPEPAHPNRICWFTRGFE